MFVAGGGSALKSCRLRGLALMIEANDLDRRRGHQVKLTCDGTVGSS